jgi:CDP-diacylglycerol---serine O-phosphatidyltransferase
VLGFALISTYPAGVLFALFLAYAASGYAILGWRWLRRRRAAAAAHDTPTEQ